MKHLTLSLIAVLAMGTSAMAEWFPADGPDSYQAQEQGRTASGEYVTRKGFRLGLGIGGANTSIDDYFRNDDLSSSGVATTFEIGYAPSNQVSINYFNNVNWGSSDEISGLTAVTFNYYIDNAVESLYLVGGFGGAVYDSDINYGYNNDVEAAGIIGIGYAMDKVEFEIDAVFSEHNDKDMRQFFFTVSYFFF